MGIGPIYAIPMLLDKTGISISDVDLFEVRHESLVASLPIRCKSRSTDALFAHLNAPRSVLFSQINEAFGSMYVYCVNTLGLDIEKVNVNGGAIALGHPLDMYFL